MARRERRPRVVKKRMEVALQKYKTNGDGVAHEFTLLHNRAAQYISVCWMTFAAYIPIFGVALAHMENTTLRLFASVFLSFVALTGVVAALLSMPGIYEALVAIKRFILNQDKVRAGLGSDGSFFEDVSLGRTPDELGNYPAHERSVLFHRALPYLMLVIWVVFLIFAVTLAFLSAAPGKGV